MKRLFVYLACLALVLPSLADSSAPVNQTFQPVQHKCASNKSLFFKIEGLSLSADSGTVISPFILQASCLQQSELSAPSELINVTDRVEAYRLLPNGEHFSAPATIAIAYNPARLPIGYRPDDIYTFCYDSAIGHWSRLQRVRVDTVNNMVYSLTTHFTEFADFVIQVPEMPESKAFVPTDMQDLPDPDPLTGVPMIEVPKANNMGTAELTYPIPLPPGRHGLQPDLDLHYSSAGGNGLLGVGWSFAQPAITIDTRWGVPRYDLRYESEAYLINGEPFILHYDSTNEAIPPAHISGTFEPRRSKATRFYARDQRNQLKAVRHNQAPDSYWWSVITTDGTIYYYGYNPFTQTIDEQSVIRTAKGNIGYWALTCVMDRFGNYMNYVNTKADNDVRIMRIDYTGHQPSNLTPFYHVDFYYSMRDDKQSDARLGVMRKQSRRLCQIHLRTETGIQLATYRFKYSCGANSLYKSRLDSIMKVDADILLLGECNQTIREALINNSSESWINTENQLYSEITGDNEPNESIPASVTRFTYANAQSSNSLFSSAETMINNTSDFSSSRSDGWNLGGAVTVGFGYNPAMTNFSAGANYAYERNKGSVQTMLIDLNGDGLLDHLSVSDNTVYYRRQYSNGTFATPEAVSGLSELSREVSSSHTFGVQLDCYGNLSYNPSISTSYTDIYFADINADGLPDLVTPSGVKLNTLHFGVPTFSAVSDNQTSLPVHGNYCNREFQYGGEVDGHIMCELNFRLIDSIPLSVILPPDDGESAFVEHTMEPDPEDAEVGSMEPHDWHPLPITEGSGQRTALEQLPPSINEQQEKHNYAPPAASGIKAPIFNNWQEALQEHYPGDDYSFELGENVVYVYHKEFICDRPQDEPNVDIVRIWVSDRNDTIQLQSLFYLLEDTSYTRLQSQYADGVRLRIQWNKGVTAQNEHLYASSIQMLFDDIIDANDYDSLLISRGIRVQQGDVIFFRMSAREDRRFDNAHWEQTIKTISGDTLYNSIRDYLCTGNQNFVSPEAGTTCTAQVSVSCLNTDTVPVRVRIMHRSDTILYHTLSGMSMLDTIILRAVTDTNRIAFYADTITKEPLWSKVRIVPSVNYWGSMLVDTPNYTLPDTLHYHPDVHIQHSSCMVSDNIYYSLFGPLHKGFGQFAYNDIQHDSLILINVLQNEDTIASRYIYANQSQYQNYDPNINVNDSVQMANIKANGVDSYFSSINAYDPLADDKRWVPMHADVLSNTWQAYGNTGTLGQYLHSTSRQLQAIADTTIITEEITEYDSPIPAKHGGMQRVRTIRKSTRSEQHVLNAGVSLYGIGVSGTASWGSYKVTSDYMDMNGDGFPDFVGKGSVQYTYPWGSIGSIEGSLPQTFASENISTGLGFSASRPHPEHTPGNGVKDSKMAFGGIGSGIAGQTGYDDTNISYIDVNADGLPDIVDAEQHRVKYNLGYSFEDNWTALPNVRISSSSHSSTSVNLAASGTFEHISDVIQIAENKIDYSLSQYSISGGFSTSTSENKTDKRLLDVNGDGYPDLLTLGANGNVSVRYYNGTSYENTQSLNIQNLQLSSTANLGFNLGITAGFDLVLIPVKFCFGVHTSPWSTSSTVSSYDFMDVNGDGYVDQVINDGTGIKVRYNRNGSTPVNLLTSVTNPTGQQISIEYSLSEPNPLHRNRIWQVSRIDDDIVYAHDQSMSHLYRFIYSDPFYDNFERMDYGSQTVNTYDNGTKYLEDVYENQHLIYRGEKISDLLMRADNSPIIGHRHEIHFYNIYDLPDQSICNDFILHVGKEGYYTDYYEGAHTPQITTHYNKFYDANHNLIRYEDDGDVAITGDEWYKTIDYKTNTTYNLRLPRTERVCDGSTNQLLRKRHVNYNRYGQAVQIIAEDSAQNIKAIHKLWYDDYGCISFLRDPLNGSGQWSWRNFMYDDTTHTHITRLGNQFGECRYFGYDLRHGLRNWSCDAAGSEMRWRYDRMGRLIDIIAPNELSLNLPYSVHYIYRLPNHYRGDFIHSMYLYPHVTKIAADTGLVSVDVTIYDARGRHVQRKSWQNIMGHYEWVTDGLRYNDPWYRPYQTYDPFVTDIIHYPFWEPDIVSHLPQRTDLLYDNLDRIKTIYYPDGSKIRREYGFAYDFWGIRRLITIHFDENALPHAQLNTPQGWTIQTATPDDYITLYQYNSIGELLSVTDADEYQTTYMYDMFGNRIQRTHPDAGTTTWTYAPNSSLIRMQTARLSLNYDSIRYNYCFDKLISISYPYDTLNNVRYKYDIAGRLAYFEDGTGSTRLLYDSIGNVRKTIRRIIVPTEDYVATFRTETKYDSFGRVKRIIYPDAEQVYYHYYQGGGLRSVERLQLGGILQPVVDKMKYDAMGHNFSRLYGNGVYTEYNYEPYRNRLSRIRTITPFCGIQDINYYYDYVGNIMQVRNQEPTCYGLGGEYENKYTYDHQYRLVSSNCTIPPFPYDFTASYSPAGRLGHSYSTCVGGVANVDATHGYDCWGQTHQPRAIYDNISPARINLYWDANGNLAEMKDCDRDRGRFHDWDEENRLRMMIGSTNVGYYAYDANGERVYKLTGTSSIDHMNTTATDASVYFTNAVLYPNPYVVITPTGYTKHYYANGERLATVIGKGGFLHMSPETMDQTQNQHEINLSKYRLDLYKRDFPLEYKDQYTNTCNRTIQGTEPQNIQYTCDYTHLRLLSLNPNTNILYTSIRENLYLNDFEKYIYYTHNDHLGSSAWITASDGCPIQYLHYLPYGQLVANQQMIGYDERFKFLGKERDLESGYDYLGARFYASPFKHFISPEPLLDQYLHISPYSYASWNPINRIDPDGRWSVSVQAFSNRAQSPYAIYKVHNRQGDLIYQTVVKVKGWQGAKYRDRKITSGDTPTGLYRMNFWRKPKDSGFGVNDFIDQDYLEGEGIGPGTSNRNRMHTHGGGDILNETGELVGLKGTSGCIRMADEDIKEMKSITDALQNLDPQENMTTLTVSNDLEKPIDNFSQSRKDVKNGNGGFWLPEIEVTP